MAHSRTEWRLKHTGQVAHLPQDYSQNPVIANFDIHDRVNYAVLNSSLEFKTEKKIIQMNLELDDSMCTVMDYFGIFLERMMMCRRAAEVLGWRFKLVANGSKLC